MRTLGTVPKPLSVEESRADRTVPTSLPQMITFRQNGAFHEMVGAFMAASVGLLSLIHPDNPMGFKADQIATLEGKVHGEVRLGLLSLHRQTVGGIVSPAGTINSLICMLINIAYESVKSRDDRSPNFEFFRHLRNASSHKNTFNFFPNEPKLPASWRGQTIDQRMKGKANPLWGTQCFGTFLGSADAIVLLWDIEQRLA